MSDIFSREDLKKLHQRMSRLAEDLSSEIGARYPGETKQIQERMNRLLDEIEASFRKDISSDIIRPLCDISSTDESVVVTLELPGIDKKDVEIAVSGEDMSVKASRPQETTRSYVINERTYTGFKREIKLPVAVKAEEAKGTLKDGILEVVLPKEVVTTRRRVTID